jgi:cysteate synthase
MSHFRIKCRRCGKVLENTYCAFCEHCSGALLVSEYEEPIFSPGNGTEIWRFNWLPVHKASFPQPSPVVYKSSALADFLGLKELYIAFSGYWKDRGALLKTCTFKELEAAVVIQNARENGVEGLVVASAGNTARAMAHLSLVSSFSVIIVVPTMCLMDMWYLEPSTAVPTVALTDGDYSDSIEFARKLAVHLGYPFEGGVKNIAKRDGLGVILLEAVERIGRMPDHYFQAVGSGTGAIGVWEMAERLLKDGRFGKKLPVLHLSQNLPFAPMTKAWQRGERELSKEDLDPSLIPRITTRVLSNRYPAYSVIGGVYDALKATGGRMYGIENQHVYRAMELFESLEGVDIVPAAAVAVASLMEAAKEGYIKKTETVLLNITGGGEKRLSSEHSVSEVTPICVSKSASPEEVEELLCSIQRQNS